jgi:DNA-binding MarR family transcriptional regulator
MALHPNESPGFLLWHITLRWQRRIAAALAPLDLTHVQFVLLACTWWLNEQRERPTQVRLAAQAGTDVKMTSQVLKALEKRGLVEREVDPADTRARRLRATPRGERLAPRAIAVVEAVDAEFFSELGTADAIDFLGRLAHVSESGGGERHRAARDRDLGRATSRSTRTASSRPRTWSKRSPSHGSAGASGR